MKPASPQSRTMCYFVHFEEVYDQKNCGNYEQGTWS